MANRMSKPEWTCTLYTFIGNIDTKMSMMHVSHVLSDVMWKNIYNKVIMHTLHNTSGGLEKIKSCLNWYKNI